MTDAKPVPVDKLGGIEIKNYRGIREGNVSGFGLVNIFVGPNGSGKSTLLESIFLGAHRSDNFRSQHAHSLIAERHNESESPADGWWHRRDSTQVIDVSYRFQSQTYPRLQIGNKHQIHFDPNYVAHPFFLSMRFLDTQALLDKNEEERSWDRLFGERGDRLLIKTINQVYGLKVESLTYIPARSALRVGFNDRDYALDIDDLSTGMRTALRLFMVIMLTRNSAVLVEEFDAYQHIQTLPRLAKAIFELTRQAKTQLFLTTHSMETVNAFVNEAKGLSEDDLKIFQTSLSPDGKFETSRAMNAEVASTLIDGGIDIRSAR